MKQSQMVPTEQQVPDPGVSSPAKSKVPGELFILMSAVCFSISGLLIKYVPWNPMAIAGVRSLLAAPILLIFSKKVNFKLTKLSFLAAVCTFLSLALYIAATKMTTAANAIVLQYVAPVFVVLYAFLFLKQIPSKLDTFALFLCSGGIVLFFLDSLSGGGLLGNVFALLSGVFYAGIYFINSLEGGNPVLSTLLGHLIMAIVGVPFLFAGENPMNPQIIFVMLVLGIFQLGLGYLFFTKGIVRTSALSAILISMVEPILNPVLVFIVIREVPGTWAMVGGCLVIFSITGWNVLKAMRSKAG